MTTIAPVDLRSAFERAIEYVHGSGCSASLTPSGLVGQHRPFTNGEQMNLASLIENQLGIEERTVLDIFNGDDSQFTSEDWTDVATGNLEPNLVLQGRRCIYQTGARVDLRIAQA